MNYAQKFFTLYRGLERAHGRYIPAKEKKKGERKLEATDVGTVREPVTVELWDKHLKGEYGVGIIPITDDNTCWWGAIDIDSYEGFDWEQLERDLTRMELPVIPCKTKSGGCHLYLFCAEPVLAELVRGRLMEWAVALGHSGVEVFPKQTRLASRDDVGNWINMPYFGGDETTRYAIQGGKQLSMKEFLKLAEACAVSEEELKNFAIAEDEKLSEFLKEAPPCLQCLAKRGFGEGGRNRSLFNIGVYLRNRFGDDAFGDKMDEYNQTFMTPPLGHKEVQQIVKNVGKKTYAYTCNEDPIRSVCNKQICLTRKYGIKGVADDPGVQIGKLTKLLTTPPKYIWEINGKRIELETDDVLNQHRFHKICFQELDIMTQIVKPATWNKMIQEKLSDLDKVEVPADATVEGQMWIHLEQFCTGSLQARSEEELLLGKPFTEGETTLFSSGAFIKYCESQRFHIKERELWVWLRRRPSTTHMSRNIKGKFANYWGVPAFAKQTEEFTTGDKF